MRYSRTRIGFGWALTPVMIYTVSFYLIFSNSGIFERNNSFLFIYFGLTVWNLLSSFVLEGINVFNNNRSFILNSNTPIAFYALRQVSRNVINFLIVIIPGILVAIVQGNFSWTILTFFPFYLSLICFLGFSLICVFGVCGTLYPDLAQLVSPAVQVMFIVTPVFWSKSILEHREFLFQLNPFYWAVEVLRLPLLGQFPSLLNVAVIISLGVISFILLRLLKEKVEFEIPLNV